MNQLTNMVDAAGTTKFAYTDAGDLLSEEAPWTYSKVTYGYHASVPHLRTSLSLQQPTGNWTESYTPDASGRLETLSSSAGDFTYTYHGAGTLWTNLALPTYSAITNAYDTSERAKRP
ncbi:MAG: hypothetical protein M1608_04975, partial [Candidatus Omnitrophica bacterium]|nr:hypothetical protein [Candidatus Omnitrophota bacterium]